MVSYGDRQYKKLARQIRRRGAAVTFTSIGTDEVYDETAAASDDDTSESIAGMAVEVPGSPEEYAAAGLTAVEPVTLVFVPDTIGTLPGNGSICLWAGVVRTVRQRYPFRPDGTGIGARLLLS